MEEDIKILAHLVRTSYLPQFKKDIENTKDEVTKPMLEQRYSEVEKIINKYLEK